MAEQRTPQESSEQSSQQRAGSQLQTRSSQALQNRGSSMRGGGSALNLRDLLDPFSFMRRMYDDLDRVFMQSDTRNLSNASAASPAARATWVPAIEVSERDRKLVVSAELPGVEDADVRVEIVDDSLVIEGERKFEREENEGGVYRSERAYGRFYRVVPLPDGVDPTQAEARLDNGVLEVSFPLPENRRKQIPVQTSAQGEGRQRTTQGSSQKTEAGTHRSDTGKAA